MANLSIIDLEGKEVEKFKISDEIVKQKVNSEVLYQEVRRYLSSVRAGTHSTKDRSEVRGGGKKPWRQKGTGNARAGTNRSPLWRGGGIVFGPKPRDYSFKLNKKVIKKSKLIALSEKYRDKKFIVIEKIEFDRPSTKKASMLLNTLNLSNKKVLVVVDNVFNDAAKSFRNINNIMIESPFGLNAYNILVAEYILFSRDSLNKLIERLGDGQS